MLLKDMLKNHSKLLNVTETIESGRGWLTNRKIKFTSTNCLHKNLLKRVHLM